MEPEKLKENAEKRKCIHIQDCKQKVNRIDFEYLCLGKQLVDWDQEACFKFCDLAIILGKSDKTPKDWLQEARS